MRHTFCSFILLISLALSQPLGLYAEDWPQWGGHDARNMISSETGLPDSFVPGEKDTQGGGIVMATTRNVQWTTRLGSYAYGNPVVAGGRLFVGTDIKSLASDSRFKHTKGGLVKCLDETTGKLLWQLITPERRMSRRVFDD